MLVIRGMLIAAVLAVVFEVPATAQLVGSFDLQGRPRIDGKTERLKRKRFYLFPGGLAENKDLIERIKASSPISRDCYYCQMKASPEYIAWLKAGDCESPYCRTISSEDVAKVPEFKAAFQKGMGPRQFNRRTAIAEKWITTNLVAGLRDGFYQQRKSVLNSILAGTKPLQSSMTDNGNASSALFIDIGLKPVQPGGKSTETFLFSNLVPIEIGAKSYVWACEVEIGSTRRAVYLLKVPESGKTVPKCEVIVRELPACEPGNCEPK